MRGDRFPNPCCRVPSQFRRIAPCPLNFDAVAGTPRKIRVVGDPVLHAPTRQVTSFDDELANLSDDTAASLAVAEGGVVAARPGGRRPAAVDVGWRGAPGPARATTDATVSVAGLRPVH